MRTKKPKIGKYYNIAGRYGDVVLVTGHSKNENKKPIVEFLWIVYADSTHGYLAGRQDSLEVRDQTWFTPAVDYINRAKTKKALGL